MAQDGEIKIRTLPRTKPKRKAGISATQSPRWIIYAASCVSLLIAAYTLFAPDRVGSSKQGQDLASIRQVRPVDTPVQRYMQDAAVKREMLRRTRELENLKAAQVDPREGLFNTDESALNYGLQFDQEDTAERVYEDLNDGRQVATETLPADRISARLADRRWLNQYEREERINFVRNFLRSAYERGYEVELDQNLVVVNVKKVNRLKRVNIDQVIDRMARQGL